MVLSNYLSTTCLLEWFPDIRLPQARRISRYLEFVKISHKQKKSDLWNLQCWYIVNYIDANYKITHNGKWCWKPLIYWLWCSFSVLQTDRLEQQHSLSACSWAVTTSEHIGHNTLPDKWSLLDSSCYWGIELNKRLLATRRQKDPPWQYHQSFRITKTATLPSSFLLVLQLSRVTNNLSYNPQCSGNWMN